MKLSDRFDGSRDAFEGDRTLLLRSLPANARVQKAAVRLTPTAAADGALFQETITFGNDGVGTFGATRVTVANFVEVDFHKRRTLAAVQGSNLSGANLQVDIGGLYVEINANGAIKTPDPPGLFALPSTGVLPGLTVSKFKLTAAAAVPLSPPAVTSVTIRSVPTNVTVRLGDMPPFWTRLGEMTQAETSPDFAAVLQAFLAGAKIENGFYVVPLVVHSDSLARFSAELEVDYLVGQSTGPAGVDDVALAFGAAGAPTTPAQSLTLTIPANARVATRGVSGRVTGAFEETRILYPPDAGSLSAPTGEVIVSASPVTPLAQPVQTGRAVAATAIDLLLAVKRNGALQLDVREDLDGKPGSASLFPAPIRFDVAGPVPLASGGARNEDGAEARWMTVPLPATVQFENGRTYWLVLQSIDGEAGWKVARGNAGKWEMQRTQDGGLSWRPAGPSGPVAAFFRLRGRPERFTMPIALEAGRADTVKNLKPQRVELDRFSASGRVDFTLDIEEISDAINEFLDDTAPAGCPEVDHLVNGDFKKWLRLGDDLTEPVETVDLGANVQALAVAPDSSRAYVLTSDAEVGRLEVVNIACGRTIADERVDFAAFAPEIIVLSPDGSRAYVAQAERLQIVDLDNHRTFGGFFDFTQNIRAMALSPDGGLLFISIPSTAGAGSRISMVDTAELERFVIGSGFQPKVAPVTDLEMFSTANVLSISPLGAGTPDGKLVIVPDTQATNVSVIDIATKAPVAAINVGGKPVAVAVSPDGTRAYVAIQAADRNVNIIDLTRRQIVSLTLTVAPLPTSVAVSPNGDYILVGSAGSATSNSLSLIQVGSLQPQEWNLVSGRVTRRCLSEPFHPIALLGAPAREATRPTVLSQVVPISESCPYDIRFRGIASDQGAAAEIRWLAQNCDLVGVDPERVPIGAPNAAKAASIATASDAAFDRLFALHYKRLTAPKGAKQAEIRFTVPDGVVAAIGEVSFGGTTETVANADFTLRQDGRLADWTLISASSSGVLLRATDATLYMQNLGDDTVELVQTVPAKGGQSFALKIEGQVLRAKTEAPRVELGWLNDTAPIGELVIVETPPDGLSSSAANGTSPEKATHAEIHLVAPPGTARELRRVSLKFTPTLQVPLTFVAQAPGELTVSGLSVALEKAEMPAPAVPETGICMPAPVPDVCEEEEPCEDRCFCACCQRDEHMTDTIAMQTEAGRPVQVGRCANCGTRVVRFGGPRAPGAPRFTLARESAPPPVVLIRSLAGLARSRLEIARLAAPRRALTDIEGIGEVRAGKLTAAGIDSPTKLAATSVDRVVELLAPGISEEMAAKLIQDAARLAEDQPPSPPT